MKTPEEMAEEYCNTKQLNYVEQLVITKGFIDGYKAAQNQLADVSKVMPQWISVKDRLPNVEKTSCSLRRESSCVLIVSYDNVYVAHLCEKWCDRTHFIFCACDCSCRGYDMEQDEWELDQVTHWMPLPEPPKEEK